MSRSSFKQRVGNCPKRRVATLVLVGLVLWSTVVSSGLAAAYAPAGPGNPHPSGNSSNGSSTASGGGGWVGSGSGTTITTTASTATTTSTFPTGGASANASSSAGSGATNATPKQPVNATIRQFKQQHLGYANLSTSDKQQLRKILAKIQRTDSKKGKIAVLNTIPRKIDGWQGNPTRRRIIKRNFGIGTVQKVAGNPVNATITQFKQQQLGYAKLSPKQKQTIRKDLQQLKQSNVGSPDQITQQQRKLLQEVAGMFGKGEKYGTAQDIIKKNFQVATDLPHNGYGGAKKGVLKRILPDIPSLMDKKLKSIGDAFKKGATNILSNVYAFAFSTPVPKNDGWKHVFGTPTNQPFKQLHTQLLTKKLYPVTNILLGMGVLVLGISLTVNPFLSRFRILDLMIKFVSFLLLYTFSWVAVTLMHGAVNDIVLWIRPSPAEITALATNINKMSAAAIGAYFAGSGGILTTVFGLGLELGLRNVMLKYFFPYIFPVLVFLLYVSPWQRLKSFASMTVWQYVNVLTMVIPMAVFLKAVTLVSFKPGKGVAGMLILVALFLATLSVPFITTYFYLQMPGKVGRAGYSAAAGAASRVGTAKDKLGWGDDSDSESTATGDTSPGDRTEDAVEASSEDSSGVPSSGSLSDESIGNMDPTETSQTQTTAGKVRSLDAERDRDPMNPTVMKESYFETETENRPRRTTMREKLAD